MPATRREFLKSTLGASALMSLGPAVPRLLDQAACAAPPRPATADTVLVVVQLAGGNDGLNTVVPYGDDLYGNARPTLRLPAEQLFKLDSLLGLHPQMQGFLQLLQEGHLSIVQGVGYPQPRQDHFESMRIWQTAKIEPPGCQTGWLGRAADALYDPEQPRVPAVFVGKIVQPFSLNAQRAIIPTIRAMEQFTLHVPPGPGNDQEHYRRLLNAAELARTGEHNPLLDFVRRATVAAYATHRQIDAIVRPAAPAGMEYPAVQLAQELRTIAQLIRADLGIRVFYTELGGEEPGGFDTHANQAANHGALLHQLSESVRAFVADLQRDKLLDRVLLMTFSEFGRTVRENGRRGTDHGSAAPMFLVGGKLKGGLVGPHPSLAQLEGGGVKHHTDFRRVYATLLDRWLGWPSQPVLGGDYAPLDVLKA